MKVVAGFLLLLDELQIFLDQGGYIICKNLSMGCLAIPLKSIINFIAKDASQATEGALRFLIYQEKNFKRTAFGLPLMG